MKKRNLFLLPAVLAMFLTSCGGATQDSTDNSSVSSTETTTQTTTESTTSVEEDVLVTSISVTAAKNLLSIGETIQLSVEVLPANAANKAYDLMLEKDGILELTGNSVKAIGEGQCKVYAMAKDSSGVQGELNFVVESANPQFTTSNVIVIGDIHISESDNETKEHLKKSLQYAIDNSIDTIVFNGDLADWNDQKHFDIVDGILTEKFGSMTFAERPEFIFNMGNHDFYSDSSSTHESTDYAREHLRYRTFANKWMKYQIQENENVYSIISHGINYICAFPGIDAAYEQDGITIYEAGLGHFSSTDLVKVQNKLAEAAQRDPDKPIVVCTHWPWGETYGGEDYGVRYPEQAAQMRTIFSEYPQVVNLTSHTHFSNLHDRDISQTTYTSINVGTHCYAKYASNVENDENNQLISYENIANHKIVNDPILSAQHGKTNFGLQLSFGATKLSVNRVNFAKQALYSHGTFEIPYGITKENMNEKFNYLASKRSGQALTWSGLDILSATADEKADKVELNITLKDVDQYYAVEGYKIDLVKDSTVVDSFKWASLFWADLGEASTYAIKHETTQKEESYTIKVYPIDFYGHYGDPIEAVVNTTPNQYAEYETKELASGDLLYSSKIIENNLNKAGFTFDNYCTDGCNEASGLSYHATGDATVDGWPSIKLELAKAIDLSDSGLSLYGKFNNIHQWVSFQMFNADNEKVVKEFSLDFQHIDNLWLKGNVKNSLIREKLNDNCTVADLKEIKYVVIATNFDRYKGSNQEIYLDELHVEEVATKTNNWEMAPFDIGWSWGTKEYVTYSETYGASSAARKFTFAESTPAKEGGTFAADGSDTAFFVFSLEDAFEKPNGIDVKNGILSFDFKMSHEFFDSTQQYKHMFKLQFVDTNWAHSPSFWFDWTPDGASGFNSELTDNGWLHCEVDLAAKANAERAAIKEAFFAMDNNLLRLRFGVWCLTETTKLTASIVIDNLKIVPKEAE